MPSDVESAQFKIAYDAAIRGEPIIHVRDMPITPIEARKQRTEATLKRAIRSALTRSRMKNLAFDLDFDFLLRMATEQDFRCALTGIEFLAVNEHRGRVCPFIPSIDRIEPSKGYTKGNVRIVIYAVNAMLLDWGEDLFVQVANSYRYWNRTKKGRSKPALSLADSPHLKIA